MAPMKKILVIALYLSSVSFAAHESLGKERDEGLAKGIREVFKTYGVPENYIRLNSVHALKLFDVLAYYDIKAPINLPANKFLHIKKNGWLDIYWLLCGKEKNRDLNNGERTIPLESIAK